MSEAYPAVIAGLCFVGAGMCTIIALYTRAAIGLARGWIKTNTEQHQTLLAGLASVKAEISDVERRAEDTVNRSVAPLAKQLSRYALDTEGRLSRLEAASGKSNGKATHSWMEESDVSAGAR